MKREEQQIEEINKFPPFNHIRSAKRKKRQTRKVEDNFYQIEQYDKLLDDKLVQLRKLLEKHK